MGGHHHKNSHSTGKKISYHAPAGFTMSWVNVDSEPATLQSNIKQFQSSPPPTTSHKKKHHKKHKSTGKKIGSGFKKFGSGVVSRFDSIGKFAGNFLKTEEKAFSGLLESLSSPYVLIPVVIVGGIIVYQVVKK